MNFGDESLRNGIAELEIPQSDIGDILQISIVRYIENTSASLGNIAYQARQIGIEVSEFFPEHIGFMPAGVGVIGSIVLPPETSFGRRIPVLFHDPLEEGSQEEIIPISREVYSVAITVFGVSNDGFIPGISDAVQPMIDDIITVEVFKFKVAGIVSPRICIGDIGLGRRV